jgi:hypothetical protein
MRRLAAISLLCLSLLTHTEIAQFFKLPEFFAHYIEHRNDNPGMGIWDFVRLHYQASSSTPSDYDKDLKLPFKTSHIVQSGFTFNTPVVPAHQEIHLVHFESSCPIYAEANEVALPQTLAGSVFQPPKTV